ncbi:MAG TPA: hypothetical protein VGL99_16760 [Chloroflexota bacterium]
MYAISDGDDPDWATWYSDWLVNRSPLPQLLGVNDREADLLLGMRTTLERMRYALER